MPESFISYFSQEMVDEIISKCRVLVESRPNDPVCYRNLGHAYFKKGAYREAKEAYAKVVGLDARDTATYLAIGRCCELLHEFEAALEAFDCALTEKPDWPDTYFWKAKIFFAKGELEDAASFVKIALERNPAFKDALYLQAQIFEASGDLAEAITCLKQIIALPAALKRSKNPFPYDIDILFDDALLLKEAIRQMESVLRAEPGYADLHFKLGMAYRKMGRKEEALASFKKALQINPNMHLARHYYWHWGEDGEPKE
ncbi:MAG: tetratricopeptide repeat protein [Candidatus Riflebacteria bacterium]|nr:tetratricopeptide repeat protein [Candidatus Riflebacteria bacterium]